jgi:hypothetical protein
MIRRVFAFVLFGLIATCIPSWIQSKQAACQDSCALKNEDWVRDVLAKMETIRPGMTRAELLKVFRTEGGLSNGLKRRFVSRECAYFKVDVEFEAIGRPGHDSDGRVTVEEGPRDIIVEVSRPYLQFSIAD